MSDEHAPPVAPATITQIAVVSQQGTNDSFCTLVALCSDGSIWRLQEWNPGVWEEISQPPLARSK